MEIKKKTITVAKRSSGNDIKINTYTIGSGNPKVYIQAGIHGGEATNIWIIKELLKSLTDIKGEITFVPLANPVSWETQMYFYTCGKFSLYDGKDWNRNFPGDSEGSLGSRIADALFTIAKQSDLVIDLHTSRRSEPFAIVIDKKLLDLVENSGAEYGFLAEKVKGTLNYACDEEGIDCIALEIGSHDSFNTEIIAKGIEIIKSILSYKGLIESKIVKTKKYFTKLKTYYSPTGGLVTFSKKSLESFSKGEVLFEVCSTSDLTRTIKIKAEEDGIILKLSPTHIYNEGDEVVQIIAKESINYL